MNNKNIQHIKSLGVSDLTLFAVSAILLLDPLFASAASGVESLFWWGVLGLFFFFPVGMISAELGTAYPDQGGIYAWVRRAFGARWASRVSWAYWVNVTVWAPSLFILFCGLLQKMFFPDLSLFWYVMISITLCWLCVLFNCMTLEFGKWVPNVGALFKIILILVIIIGSLFHISDAELANSFSLEEFAPTWDSSLKYLPVVIYGMMGFELICNSAEEIKDPQKDLPRSIIYSGLIILSLYMLGSAAILALIPSDEINLVESLYDVINIIFSDSEFGSVVAIVIGLMAMYSIFATAVTWTMGANRAAAEAALEHELPSIMSIEHSKHGTPIGAAVVNGIVCTITLLAYGFMAGDNEELFWNLFTFSAVIFLLPYIGMVAAFVTLRKFDSSTYRPFWALGQGKLSIAVARLAQLLLGLAVLLLVYVPGEGVNWQVFSGVLVVLVIGEAIIRSSEITTSS